MSFDPTEVPVDQLVPSMSRYEPVGLVSNPFRGSRDTHEPAVQCEIHAASNRLLAAIYEASFEAQPKPLWVHKGDVPSSYPLAAVAHAETSLATDDALNVLYAYVQLFMFKIGVTRGTLGVLAERISFREVEKTIAAYVETILGNLDDTLASYQVLGPEKLQAFTEDFRTDPAAAVARVFGGPELERHKELIGVVDVRKSDLEDDGDETEETAEIDETVGDAPGTSVLLAQAAEQADEDSAVLDYLIEYTREHLSPVVARALRMYRERGLSAMAEELKVTKAPRKTLKAIVELSKVRYRKVALIYDELQSWKQIPVDLRSQVVGSIASIRFKLSDSAVMVFMAASDEAPELEETFGGGRKVVWDFHNLEAVQKSPNTIDATIVDEWLSSATLPGREPLTMENPVLAQLAEDSQGTLPRFLDLAREAIEDAADRGVTLDDEARTKALERTAAAEGDAPSDE